MLTAAAVLLAIFTAWGAVFFNLAWKKRHPGSAWPTFAWISLSSGLIFALALLLRSWPVFLIGCAVYAFGRYLAKRAIGDR